MFEKFVGQTEEERKEYMDETKQAYRNIHYLFSDNMQINHDNFKNNLKLPEIKKIDKLSNTAI